MLMSKSHLISACTLLTREKRNDINSNRQEIIIIRLISVCLFAASTYESVKKKIKTDHLES